MTISIYRSTTMHSIQSSLAQCFGLLCFVMICYVNNNNVFLTIHKINIFRNLDELIISDELYFCIFHSLCMYIYIYIYMYMYVYIYVYLSSH